MTVRVMGKAAFAHIEDGSGRVQIYLKRDVLGEAIYDAFFRKLVDLGDFITVTGTMFTTRTGEVTCEVRELGLLSKTLNPLPDKWHGLKDVETRFRQRYVDLLANPEVRDVFITRARIVKAIRRYLDGNGFLEVETPVLQPIYGGAAARPFVTHHNQLDQDLFLRISFELYLKRLLVGGYRAGVRDRPRLPQRGDQLQAQPRVHAARVLRGVRRLPRRDGADRGDVGGHRAGSQRAAQADLRRARDRPDPALAPDHACATRSARPRASTTRCTRTRASLAEAIRGIGPPAEPTSRGKLIDSLFGDHVEPNLIQPTFITDYPVEISPLAKKHADDPTTVERFEYFIAGMELGNAFTELNDPIDQRERFVELRSAMAGADENAHPLDEDFLAALNFGMPPTGGFGIGVDRLTMLFTDQHTIREVILFPHLRTA